MGSEWSVTPLDTLREALFGQKVLKQERSGEPFAVFRQMAEGSPAIQILKKKSGGWLERRSFEGYRVSVMDSSGYSRDVTVWFDMTAGMLFSWSLTYEYIFNLDGRLICRPKAVVWSLRGGNIELEANLHEGDEPGLLWGKACAKALGYDEVILTNLNGDRICPVPCDLFDECDEPEYVCFCSDLEKEMRRLTTDVLTLLKKYSSDTDEPPKSEQS